MSAVYTLHGIWTAKYVLLIYLTNLLLAAIHDYDVKRSTSTQCMAVRNWQPKLV